MGKIFIFLVVTFFSINCQKSQSVRSCDDATPRYDQFLQSFDTMIIPFNIDDGNLLDYQDSIIDDKGELLLNPLFRYLNGEDLCILKSKFNTEQSNFFSLSKYKVNDIYLLSLVEVDKSGVGWWLKLITMGQSGQIIDTLTFAGEKQGLYETKKSVIDKDLNVQTALYYDVEQYSSERQDLYSATEVRKKYSLLENGSFFLRDSSSQKVCFIFDPKQIKAKSIVIKCPD